MLKAKSIGYSKSGSGLIAERGLKQLGIFDQVKDKVRYLEGTPVAVFVAKGEVEIGMQQSNAIVPVAGAEYAGPLPGELQEYLYFSVGVLTISKQPDVAREFIKFMASPEAGRASAQERDGAAERLRSGTPVRRCCGCARTGARGRRRRARSARAA